MNSLAISDGYQQIPANQVGLGSDSAQLGDVCQHDGRVADEATARSFVEDRRAPPFTQDEKALIVAWADALPPADCVPTLIALPPELPEALAITPWSADEPSWIVHKTPKGEVAVRQWPGLADIVPTLAQALAIITTEVAQSDPLPPA